MAEPLIDGEFAPMGQEYQPQEPKPPTNAPDIGGEFVPVPSMWQSLTHRSPAIDQALDETDKSGVLKAFNHIFASVPEGISEGWGHGPSIPQETEDWMKKNGLFDDYKDGHANLIKQFNEAILRPALATGYTVPRVFGAGLRGAQAVTYTAAQEAGASEEASKIIPQFLEYETQRGDILAERPPSVEHIPTPSQAMRNGAIGTEKDYFHMAETPRAGEDIAEALAHRDVTDTVAPPVAPLDVHSVARQIAPDTFQEYDALQGQRNTYREQLSALSEARGQTPEAIAAQAKVDDILAKVNGVEDRLTKAAQDRLDRARDELDATTRADTAEMADIRKRLLEADFKMRDLAPDVASAYRKARDQVPEAPEPIDAPEPEAAQPEPAPVRTEGEPVNESAPNPIAPDVAQKLMAAGRPEEEARAAAAIIEAHYQARAERFKGALGSAEELYAKEGPEIKAAGRKKAVEMAQGKTLHQSARAFAPPPKPKTYRDNNYSRDLSEDTHRLYRETSPSRALEEFIPRSGIYKELGDIHFSDTPDLALGQGHNKGVLLEFESSGLRGKINKGKPITETSSGSEYIATLNSQPAYQKNLRAFRIYDSATIDRSYKERLTRTIKSLKERDGWTESRGDGFTQYERPETLSQNRMGSIILREGRNLIKLFKEADASTFMHETGHQWLEELMHDDKDERAPADLKKDASTVRDWLGIKEGDAIPTKAHEKFARGFERYLMEGVAPSRALASVFAKFKAWLTQIYQTVNRLRSPINDDIRAVFDRLISSNPERTVIAPDRAIEHEMADIHEAEAESTPAEKAGPVADQIRTEIDRVVQDRIPEVANDLRTADKIGAVEGENADIAERGDGGEGADDGANVIPSSPEPAGGNEAPREGVEPGIGPEPAAARGGPTPAGLDKAGNIRLENLNTSDDARAIIRQLATDTMDFNNSRYGLASYTLYHQIKAAKRLLETAADATAEAEKKWNVSGADSDGVAYILARGRSLIAAEQYSEMMAGWGRAGHAFRKISNLAKGESVKDYAQRMTGRTLDQLKDEGRLLNQLDTTAQKIRFLEDSAQARWTRFKSGFISYFINNLISGPITHAGYSIGNTVWAMFKAVPTTAMAATIDTLRGAEGADRVYYGEIPVQLYAMIRGTRDSIPAAVRAASTGVPFMKGLHELDKLDAATEGTPAPLGEGALRQQQIFANSGPLLRKTGYVLETPGRVVSSIHTIFYGMGYEQEIARRAYRAAMADNLSGDRFAARVAEFTQNPPEADIAAAHEEALKMVLMKKPAFDSSMAAFQRSVNKNLLAKLIMPFMQIGTNILREGLIEHSPLGLASKEVRENLSGRNGDVARTTQYAKIAVGTGVAISVMGLTGEGILTGGGPSDFRKRRVLESTGWKPYAIRIGDFYVPYRKYLGPLGPLVAGTSDIYEVGHTLGDEGLNKAAAATVFGLTEVVADETWMMGLSKFIDAARHWDTDGERYLRGLAVDFIPFSVGMRQMATLVDPYARQQNDITEAARSVVPFASQDLLPRRDIWGEPMQSHTALSPSLVATDPVSDELLKLDKYYPAPPLKSINGVKLSEEQYDDYCRISGRYAKLQLMHDMQAGYWERLDDDSKVALVKADISSARRQARAVILAQDPTIWQRAAALKLSQQRNGMP